MKKSATKTVYIDHWFIIFGEPYNSGVTATQLPNGKWVCELNIPLVNQTVKAIAKTAANAMANASEKATVLVDKYLSEHPEIKFMPKSCYNHYEFYEDEQGFTSIRVKPSYRKKLSDRELKMQIDSAKVMEKAIAKIQKINGIEQSLFIQVIDRSLFGEDASTKEIQDIISSHVLDGLTRTVISWQTCSIVGNSVIVIGHTMEMD